MKKNETGGGRMPPTMRDAAIFFAFYLAAFLVGFLVMAALLGWR